MNDKESFEQNLVHFARLQRIAIYVICNLDL